MEDFKIQHFNDAMPGVLFPKYRTLPSADVASIRNRLAARLCIAGTSDTGPSICRQIASAAVPLEFGVAANESFSLAACVRQIGIRPDDRVFINWFHFDAIDEISFADLTMYFSDIWYPSSDDIDVFDDTLLWILSISHEGDVLFTNLKGPGNTGLS